MREALLLAREAAADGEVPVGCVIDPSVLASNDTKTWVAPDGLTNPLTPAPKPGHNCDVELVYNRDCNELWLYYVEADDIVQSWVKLMRSKDGVHWTKPEINLFRSMTPLSRPPPCLRLMVIL